MLSCLVLLLFVLCVSCLLFVVCLFVFLCSLFVLHLIVCCLSVGQIKRFLDNSNPTIAWSVSPPNCSFQLRRRTCLTIALILPCMENHLSFVCLFLCLFVFCLLHSTQVLEKLQVVANSPERRSSTRSTPSSTRSTWNVAESLRATSTSWWSARVSLVLEGSLSSESFSLPVALVYLLLERSARAWGGISS